MTPPVGQQAYPRDAYTLYNNRPIRGIVLHHTATPGPNAPTMARGRSWHGLILRDNPGGRGFATLLRGIPDQHAAHTVGNCNRWRPSWMVNAPDGRVSPPNYCTKSYEVVYNPVAPDYQKPTAAQLATWRWAVEQDYLTYGPLPIVGHGEIDSDKMLTEPHNFAVEYPLWGLTPLGPYGHYLATPPQPDEGDDVDPISDADLQAYLSQLGFPVNMDTAIIKRVALSYRRGENRGPAVSDEYHYQGKVRQRFTAATAEYDPATGGVSYVELNINPETEV